jgi:TROVE domain
MASVNKGPTVSVRTHEGAPAKRIDAEQELRRSVMACLLWEDIFYESGEEIAKRLAETVRLLTAEKVSAIAIEARSKMNIRHAPLLLAREMAKTFKGKIVADTIEGVIQRSDELAEFVALYWKDGRQSLSAQAKKGLARAFVKFNEYQLAKYNRDNGVKLRDVLFLCHAKPKDSEQEALWKRLIDGTMAVPNTWEVELSAGKDKAETFKRLIAEKKLGGLALLRNLRNMQQAKVGDDITGSAIVEMRTDRILPFRFVAAARYAPSLEPFLENAMFRSMKELGDIKQELTVLVDVSGSMDAALSAKSDLTRIDAAASLAMILREVCSNVHVYSFSDQLAVIPPRRGFALRDAVEKSQAHNSTLLGAAVAKVGELHPNAVLVAITDEQSHDAVPNPAGKGFLINVASNRNGVGYGKWIHIDGFSENIVRYIVETLRGEEEADPR